MQRKSQDTLGLHLVLLAALGGCHKVLRPGPSLGGDIKTTDSLNDLVLGLAASLDHVAIVKVLLERDPGVGSKGGSPLGTSSM